MTLTGPSTPGDDLPIIWRQNPWRSYVQGVVFLRVNLAGVKATFNEWALIQLRDGG